VADTKNRLRFLGKHLPLQWRSRSCAEFAGISRISSALYKEFCPLVTAATFAKTT
jgi:hypothetical protein